MTAWIYAGGPVCTDRIADAPEPNDLTIAADSGWKTAQALGITPAVLVGDFDSLGQPDVPAGTEILRVPVEKDDTDAQLAVRVSLERGATEIVLIAGLGGRVDHTLSLLGILELLHAKKVRAILTDGRNRVRLLQNDSLLLARDARYRFLSLIAISDKVRGVSIEGCKYPLQNAVLDRRNQYAISNEIAGNAALINIRRGSVLVIESGD